MSEQDNEELDSTNQATEEVEKTEEVEQVADDQSDENEDLDLAELQEKNKRLFERAKKAEAEAKLLKAERVKKEEKVKAQEPSKKQDDFDLEDVAVLVQKVSHKEDRQVVKEYAKFKNISLEQALADPIIQTTLKTAEEQRSAAAATNTGPARRGSSKPTDEQILAQAEKGIVPEDPEALAEARMNSKFKKK